MVNNTTNKKKKKNIIKKTNKNPSPQKQITTNGVGNPYHGL